MIEQAFARFSGPEIIHTEQGDQGGRVHLRIEDRTPEQAYWALPPELAVAA